MTHSTSGSPLSTRSPSSARARSGRLDPQLRETIRNGLVRLHTLPPDSAEYRRLRDRLVELNVPLVRHLARRFAGSDEPLDDVVQVGSIGLLKAIERFDPTRGLEFSTYAVPTILGEIKRYFRDYTWSVHVPRGDRDLHSSISTARAELSQQLGRSATVAELAQRIGASEHAVITAVDAGRAYRSDSLDCLRDELGDQNIDVGARDSRLEQVEHRAYLRPAIRSLPKRQQRVLLLRFVQDQSQTQIAAALGVSQMQVSRLLKQSVSQLRTKLCESASLGATFAPAAPRRAAR